MGRLTTAVLGLLGVNIIVAVFRLFVPGADPAMEESFALWYPLNPHFGVWQFASYMFMHDTRGFTHIFFNMFALVSFGIPLERLWGTRRFLEFYLLCGLGAAVVYTGVNWAEFQGIHRQLVASGLPAPAIQTILETGGTTTALPAETMRLLGELYVQYISRMVGASGAIYGILVAFGLTYPDAKLFIMFVPVPVAAKYIIPVLVGLDLLSGVTGFSLFGGGVAHFAHVGGALIGFCLMWYWRSRVAPVARWEDED